MPNARNCAGGGGEGWGGAGRDGRCADEARWGTRAHSQQGVCSEGAVAADWTPPCAAPPWGSVSMPRGIPGSRGEPSAAARGQDRMGAGRATPQPQVSDQPLLSEGPAGGDPSPSSPPCTSGPVVSLNPWSAREPLDALRARLCRAPLPAWENGWGRGGGGAGVGGALGVK